MKYVSFVSLILFVSVNVSGDSVNNYETVLSHTNLYRSILSSGLGSWYYTWSRVDKYSNASYDMNSPGSWHIIFTQISGKFAFDGNRLKFVGKITDIAHTKEEETTFIEMTKTKNLVKTLKKIPDSLGLYRISGKISKIHDSFLDPTRFLFINVSKYLAPNGEYIVKEAGKATHDGISCIVLHTESKTNIGEKVTLYLAPEFLHQPVKIITENEITREISIYTYKTTNVGLVPVKSQTELYQLINDKYIKIVETSCTLAEDFKFGVYVPDSEFDLEFPKGIKVYDEQIGQTITVE